MDGVFIPFVIIAGVLAFIALIITLSVVADKRRTQALEAVARSLGLSFEAKPGDDFRRRFEKCRLFNRGHGRRASRLIRGELGDLEVCVFDYRYTTGSGKNQSTHRQTVMTYSSPRISFPQFTLAPEHFFSRIGHAFGAQDVDFDEFPEFSRAYVLKGDDEEKVRAVFDRELIEFFEGNPGLTVESDSGALLIYRARRRVRPEEIQAFLDLGMALFTLAGKRGSVARA